MTVTIIIIESLVIVILLVVCAFFCLHKQLSDKMLASKDTMILYCKEQLREKDTYILSRIQKIHEQLKKE